MYVCTVMYVPHHAKTRKKVKQAKVKAAEGGQEGPKQAK
jgi:hypothetical protein